MAIDFIQLNRTFHPLSDKAASDDTDIRQLIGIGKPLGWSDLLKIRRVVILSEAGSGKTAELRHIAQELRKEGRFAFFIRLEHLGEDFESAFEEGSHDEFRAWLNSLDEAWLLLDSIDEARLRDPRDFAKAIRILGHRLGAAKQRERMLNIISRAATVSDEILAQLARQKCELTVDDEQLAMWYAVWVGTAPSAAIPQLTSHLTALWPTERQTMFAMRFIANLMGGRSGSNLRVRLHFRIPSHLNDLYLLMHHYIREVEDIDRAGTGV